MSLTRCAGAWGLALLLASGWSAGGRADDVPPKKAALLVGVNKYLKPGFDDLQFAEADVTAVGEELKKLGFEVTTLLGSAEGDRQATRANIVAAARTMVVPLGKRDVALIMLSGHGQTLNPDPNADPTRLDVEQFESYYCPVEARFNDPASQLALNFLLDEVLARDVGRKLLVLDACRDIPEDRARDRGGKNSRGVSAEGIDLRAGTSLYFSCGFGQRSFEKAEVEHGLFTHCLLDGLRGGAVKDGELAWADLVAHVNRRMRQPDILRLMPTNERQVPFPAGDLTDTVLGRLEIKPSPPQHPATLTNLIGMRLNLIPAGTFVMGGDQSPEEIVRVTAESGRSTEAWYFANEYPQHTVRISRPFYLGVHEVTQSQWRTIMGTNPSNHSPTGYAQNRVAGLDTSNHPVEMVSWFDCLEFCNKLSERDGFTPNYTLTEIEREYGSIKNASVSITGASGYRLPTEAEWEYACRAGTTTPFHFGTSNDGTQANIDGDVAYGTSTKGPHLMRPTSVGVYPANAFGLHDMHGNVEEWCFDGYDESIYKSRSGTTDDPEVTSATENRRVLRGGAWLGNAECTRSASRDYNVSAMLRSGTSGFRVARTP